MVRIALAFLIILSFVSLCFADEYEISLQDQIDRLAIEVQVIEKEKKDTIDGLMIAYHKRILPLAEKRKNLMQQLNAYKKGKAKEEQKAK